MPGAAGDPRAAGLALGVPRAADQPVQARSRDRRELVLELTPGASFEPADVEAAADRDIVLTVAAGGAVIGGMTYRLDPKLDRPANPVGGRPVDRDQRCLEHAGKLLDCLDLHGHDVRKVRVRKITVDISMEDECC